MRTSSARLSFPIALLLAAAWTGTAEADFRLVDLGAFSSNESIHVNALNASGDAVGTLTPPAALIKAFHRNAGGGSALAALPSHAGASSGVAINAVGDITGSFVDTSDNNRQHAFRISNGQFEDLDVLTNGADRGTAEGTAINSAGDIAGNGFMPGVGQRAFRMTGGTFTTIEPLAGGSSSEATGINGAGTVVGTSDIGYQVKRAFVATVSGPAVDLLGLHPGAGFGGSTYATAINEGGAVVGHGDFGAGSHAFLVSASGSVVDLGVTGSARSSYAYGLNNNMQVVGALDFGGNVLRAFTWDSSSRMVDLNTMLDAADRQSWVLSKAMAIDDLGRIAGLGYKDGQLHVFRLDPTGGLAVPAPPAWAMTMIGGTIAGGWVRFRRGRTGGRAGA